MKEIMKNKLKYFEPENYQDCIFTACSVCVFYDEKRKTVFHCIEYIKFKTKIKYHHI